MKLFDRYKISLHNIKNNKSRSILTTLIVYVISLLIMVILCIGLSFSSNMTDVTKKYYEISDEAIETSYYNYDGIQSLDSSVYASLAPVLEEHEEVISYAKYEYDGNNEVLVQNHAYSVSEYIEIIEGNDVNKSQINTNKVLVSAEYANEYFISTGEVLKPGDTFDYSFNYNYRETENNWRSISKNLELEVVGIYKAKEVEKKEYYSSVVSSSTDIIIDAEYLINTSPNLSYRSIYYYYNMPKTNFNNTEIVEKLDSFVNDLRSVLPKTQDSYENTNCYALQELKMTKTIGIVITAIAVFLCFVLILLSIGSLANTIMISVDKNKKFIGLLKALGLNEKDLKSTIKMESITTIFLGVVLSFLTIYLFKDMIGGLNTALINSAFSNYVVAVGYEAVFTIPVYVPFIVLVFFIFFTLLFARGSMSKIAKTDPMAVISEVA